MRHLKTKKWVQIFDLYYKYLNLTITKAEFENYCFDIRKAFWNKESMRNMLKKRKLYNLNMNIESQSGKLPKKDKGVGRKKKKVLDYTWINTLKDDEKDVVIKYYYRIFNENNIDADIKNIKEIENLSSNTNNKKY
ncbi:hypothetical protein [Mycoplasmopsis bovirhinis]|uniref:hypothetical protein n=1 Tax=Mycoplasmopsis bovirhinis TaxID=29553 RepID=UPI001F457326|nr:hypothetical protein [Mycoplasmopsis bovirhinis]